jgi:hypothetical protein
VDPLIQGLDSLVPLLLARSPHPRVHALAR